LGWIVGSAVAALQVEFARRQRTTIGDLYTVEPQVQWSAIERGKIVSWTVDGLPLETVRFVRGLDDGEPLFPDQRPDAKPPTFGTRMTPEPCTSDAPAGEVME
jgi:hypothetical protein